jgi:hypothetical protein
MPNRTAYTEGNNNRSSVIEGENGKKYCPNDRRLLVYRDDIQIYFVWGTGKLKKRKELLLQLCFFMAVLHVKIRMLESLEF